jgi:hypothetical protein
MFGQNNKMSQHERLDTNIKRCLKFINCNDQSFAEHRGTIEKTLEYGTVTPPYLMYPWL